MRVAFAAIALSFSATAFAGAPLALYFVVGYALLALLFQWAIHRGYGAGETRSLAMGIVDIAFLSYAVHLQGPATSVLPIGYLLVPVINASASSTRSRVAMRLALAGSLAYMGLVALCATGWIPYAPSRPELGGIAPSLPMLACSAFLVVLSLLVTTNLVLRHVLALHRANLQLRELSQRDELTQLYNRRHLIQQLRRELSRVERGRSLGLMMIDLD
ncbi:MAG: GGDEF domain-containing protein, partial [Candidatus Devosia euplotis]|nr:GGDEF domain-containing protein [Candidatus Devosia euplotis]